MPHVEVTLQEYFLFASLPVVSLFVFEGVTKLLSVSRSSKMFGQAAISGVFATAYLFIVNAVGIGIALAILCVPLLARGITFRKDVKK